MPRERAYYRENLEQILKFTGGGNLLTITDVRDFTGVKDRRTVKRMFPFNSSNRISAATLAAYLSDQAAGGDGR